MLISIFAFSLSVGCRYWFVQSASRHLAGGRPFSRASSRVGSFMRQESCTKSYSSNVLQFNFCWHCGTPPYRGPPVPRDPRVLPVQTDLAKLRARRDAVLEGMAEQPGQQRKCKVPMISMHSSAPIRLGFAGGNLGPITMCLLGVVTSTHTGRVPLGCTTCHAPTLAPTPPTTARLLKLRTTICGQFPRQRQSI